MYEQERPFDYPGSSQGEVWDDAAESGNTNDSIKHTRLQLRYHEEVVEELKALLRGKAGDADRKRHAEAAHALYMELGALEDWN